MKGASVINEKDLLAVLEFIRGQMVRGEVLGLYVAAINSAGKLRELEIECAGAKAAWDLKYLRDTPKRRMYGA